MSSISTLCASTLQIVSGTTVQSFLFHDANKFDECKEEIRKNRAEYRLPSSMSVCSVQRIQRNVTTLQYSSSSRMREGFTENPGNPMN